MLPLIRHREINTVIFCRSKLRKWAFDNAYTLTLMAVLFAITWVALFVVGVYAHAQ